MQDAQGEVRKRHEDAARLGRGWSAFRKMIRSQYLLVGLDDLDVMVVEEVTGGVVKCCHG